MLKLLKSILIVLLAILAIYFICFQVFDLKTVVMKKMYPRKYTTFVEHYAKEYEVDPLLIFAIIKAESNFEPEAKSKSEAKGLMQLMENTALEIAEQIEIETIEEQDLYNPQINIQIGTYYFSILLKQYHQNMGLALAAYNAGMGRVGEWIQNGVIKEDGSDLENIPYQETNMYVRKILNDYQIYKELYD